jgi:hypothetical protein
VRRCALGSRSSSDLVVTDRLSGPDGQQVLDGGLRGDAGVPLEQLHGDLAGRWNAAAWSTPVTPLVARTSGLRVAPGQPNHRTFNQWWKVRMLAGWGHYITAAQRLSGACLACSAVIPRSDQLPAGDLQRLARLLAHAAELHHKQDHQDVPPAGPARRRRPRPAHDLLPTRPLGIEGPFFMCAPTALPPPLEGGAGGRRLPNGAARAFGGRLRQSRRLVSTWRKGSRRAVGGECAPAGVWGGRTAGGMSCR